jgi:D-cysteine desulfhydrase
MLRYTARDRGRRPYLLPPGGSTPLGALGYVNAALELAKQVSAGEVPEPEAIVLAVGSGGTAAGLALGLGLAGMRSKVVGVAITRAPTTWALTVRRMAMETARLIRNAGAPGVEARLAEVAVFDQWLGGGYGRATRESEEALRLAATEEGVILDPTYTAKTMAGLTAMSLSREFRGPVLYWHTYDARMPGDERVGPADYAVLPREFRRFCPAV